MLYVFSVAADVVLFNSSFNLQSFIDRIKIFLSKIPDYKPDDELIEKIRKKSEVLFCPIQFPAVASTSKGSVLHIVWPHRW